ncbi:ABC transporter ATP-binding protein [Kineococcus sp. SYSU DK001]|uniref:ABC transporter ATP-binding protein n=1 Tax=Kineococcus sp. SYSU DK001 TaxID=3383122 RepID=UPI003D7DB689
MPEVVVEELVKQFGTTTVLEELDFTIADGEFFTLLGASGCGKSTTLNCIAGLERPSGGRIRVGSTQFVDTERGTFLVPEERNLGMVFQSYALWPHMSIAENLAMPLKIRKVERGAARRRIEEALGKVGLTHLADRYPHQLSGGQQQRVALARALVYSPSVLLLDEPLSNLDAKLREQARAWLKRLQSELGITTVYVTHDQDEALALSDRIAVMAGGRMLQVDTPAAVYERPATAQVAAFVGKCNFLHGTVAGVDGDLTSVRLDTSGDVVHAAATGWAAGDEVTLAIRPERLAVVAAADGAGTGAVVLDVDVLTESYVGSRFEYVVRLGRHTVQVENARGGLHGAARLVVSPQDVLVFPRADDVVPEEAEELMTV